MRILLRGLAIGLVLYGVLLGGVGCVQRRLLYFPTHFDGTALGARAGLVRWEIDGEYTGYARVTDSPRKVWLVVHGNGGQAAGRGYVAAGIPVSDSVYVLEFPGYGERPGSPSKTTFDAAALKAYEWLVRRYSVERLMVLGESLGSGPACTLARASTPPKHLVLVVPFDVLKDVAQEHYPFLPVSLIMLDRWDNVAALKGFTGRLDIYGGTHDPVIPVTHARALAAACPGAVYHEFSGGHDWSASGEVRLRDL